jgi:hypothetical protein
MNIALISHRHIAGRDVLGEEILFALVFFFSWERAGCLDGRVCVCACMGIGRCCVWVGGWFLPVQTFTMGRTCVDFPARLLLRRGFLDRLPRIAAALVRNCCRCWSLWSLDAGPAQALFSPRQDQRERRHVRVFERELRACRDTLLSFFRGVQAKSAGPCGSPERP